MKGDVMKGGRNGGYKARTKEEGEEGLQRGRKVRRGAGWGEEGGGGGRRKRGPSKDNYCLSSALFTCVSWRKGAGEGGSRSV